MRKKLVKQSIKKSKLKSAKKSSKKSIKKSAKKSIKKSAKKFIKKSVKKSIKKSAKLKINKTPIKRIQKGGLSNYIIKFSLDNLSEEYTLDYIFNLEEIKTFISDLDLKKLYNFFAYLLEKIYDESIYETPDFENIIQEIICETFIHFINLILINPTDELFIEHLKFFYKQIYYKIHTKFLDESFDIDLDNITEPDFLINIDLNNNLITLSIAELKDDEFIQQYINHRDNDDGVFGPVGGGEGAAANYII